MNELLNFGLSGIVAYGAVSVVSHFVRVTSEQKFALLVIIALAVGFVPVDLGNSIFNHIKEAVAVAFGVQTLHTVSKRMAGER